MSLQVNLSARDIATAYQSVLNGSETDWALFTYDKASNDLKVQSTGSRGLEELEEEFSDGRIQYAFVRVKDPNTELPKFVQINWCGDGVPEAKKGLFHTHASAVAQYLKGTHVVISARNEADVSPELIMKRVRNASGSKYSVHKEPARKVEPIAPVGTNYMPIGKVDISALRKGAPKEIIDRVGTSYTPARDESAGIRATPPPPPAPPRPVYPTKPSWEEDTPASVPSPLAVLRPIPSSRPSAASPATYLSRKLEDPPRKLVEDEYIAPVGTAYTPVSLPTPKKLVNPFEARQKGVMTDGPPRSIPDAGVKKLTWSERQALAKKQQAEEENQSKAASVAAVGAIGIGVGTVMAAVANEVIKDKKENRWEDEGNDVAVPAIPIPPPPSPPPMLSFASSEPEHDSEAPPASAPPPPPPPPPPPVAVPVAVSSPPEPPESPAEEQDEMPLSTEHRPGGCGIVAIVHFAYEATEENEIDLIEGEVIEQIQQLDEGWWSGVGAGGSKSGLFPANYVEIVEKQTEETLDEAALLPSPPPPPPPPLPGVAASSMTPSTPEPEALIDEGLTAIALYDYDAAEDNEITFHEGDKITHIETTSEGWWQGTTRAGYVGLFPANYVEVQE